MTKLRSKSRVGECQMEVGNSCQADVRQYSHDRIEDVGSYQRSKRFSVAGAEELGGMLVNE